MKINWFIVIYCRFFFFKLNFVYVYCLILFWLKIEKKYEYYKIGFYVMLKVINVLVKLYYIL